MIFLGSLYGVQAPYCWNLVEKQNFRGFGGEGLTIILINHLSSFLSNSGIVFFRKIIMQN